MEKGKRVVALFLTAAMVFGVCDWAPMGLAARSALAEFTLPRAMKEIREEAFINNESITGTISTGETKKIKERAFFESGLFGVRIEESAQYIGEDAFVTPNIAYAYFEGKNTEVEEGAFDGALYIFGYEDSAAKRWYDGSYTNAEFIPIDKMAEDETFFYLLDEEGQTAQVLLPVNPEKAGTSITVPSEVGGYQVTTIGENAFIGMAQVKQVTVPKGVIVPNAAKDKLAKEVIIEEIKDATPIDAFKYEIHDDHAVITGYTDFLPMNVIIPQRIEGYPVTSIGLYAFSGRMSLESIEFPDTIQTIKDGAFNKCESLKTVTFGTGLVSIDSYAFQNCVSLSSIQLPDSLHAIGNKAFSGCTELKTVNLPLLWQCDSRVSPAIAPFAGSGVTNVIIPEGIVAIPSQAFYGTTELKEVILPSTIERIGYEAFKDSQIEKITLPEGLLFIDDDAFYNSKLIAITIPASVAAIGNDAFAHSDQLTEVVLQAKIGELRDQFEACTALREIILPENGITEISYGFNDCSALEKITIPGSVKKISYSFENCIALSSVTITRPITTIQSSFNNCTELATIGPLPEANIYSSFENCPKLGTILTRDLLYGGFYGFGSSGMPVAITLGGTREISVSIYSNETSISNYIINVDGPTGTHNLTFPIDEENIEEEIYEWDNNSVHTSTYTSFILDTNSSSFNAPGEYTLTLNATNKQGYESSIPLEVLTVYVLEGSDNPGFRYTVENGEITITGGTDLLPQGEIIIPKTINGLPVRYIGDWAFANTLNRSTTAITIEADLISIGSHAFESCYANLERIELPETLETIGYGAFAKCYGLKTIELPDSLTSLGMNAFESCSSLETITIPAGVKRIERETFRECDDLKAVTFKGKLENIGAYAFAFINDLDIELPAGIQWIEQATFWGNNSYHDNARVILYDGVIGIGSIAFADLGDQSSVTIPKSVTNIDFSAFSYYKGKICGCPGSYAEAFANENDIAFVAVELPQDEPSQEEDFNSIIFTMTPNPAVVGSEVTFEITAPQAEKVRLVVDKVRYEEIELTDGQATYHRVINKAGDRKVTFEPWVDGTWGEAAKEQTLVVTANDILDEPELTLDGGSGKIGEDYSFGLGSVEHADNYHIRVYQPITGALVYYDVISASELAAASNRVTVGGAYLQKDGQYGISVIAVGYGYSQRESTGSFVVGASDYSVQVLTPHEGDGFKAGDTFHMSAQQSGGGYVQLRVEGPAPALYPQEEPYCTSEVTYRADMPVTVAGDYTISAVVYATEDSDTPAAEPHTIHVHVKGPGIVSKQVGQNGAPYTWIEPGVDQMKAFIAANDAVDRVSVSEGGVTNTASYDAAIGKYVADLPSSAAGKHTIAITAYDDDILTSGAAASVTGTKTFYIAEKLDTPVLVYPDAETVEIVKSPIDGSNVAIVQGGEWFEPLVKTHDAGDWVKVRTIGGESEGFVERSKISDTLPTGASGAIEILSPVENGKQQTGSQTMTVNWHAGLALSDNPAVEWTITGLDSSENRSQTSQGFGTAALDVSGLEDGLYELSASVSDIGGQTYSATRRFQIGEMTKEEKYREWFNKEIVPTWWQYHMNLGVTASDHPVKWQMDRLENILIGGYLYQGAWLLPWKNFKEGLHHNSTVYDAETELARDRLIVVANSVKKDEEKGKLTLAKDYSNMNALVREKQNTALREKRFKVFFDAVAAAFASAKSGMDVAAFTGGMSADETKKWKDGILNLTDNVMGALEIVVTDWVEKYDAEVLLAAYIDEYKAALEETCDDYVAHLEKAYFGGMDVEEYKKAHALSDSQSAAAQYINAFKAYRAQVAAIPDGAAYLQSPDHYAYNEGAQHAIADLLEFSGLEFGSMSDFDSYSANMWDALWEAMPGICLKLVDYFAELMADKLLEAFNDKSFIEDNPVLSSIPVKDLEKTALKSCFKKMLKLKAVKDKNTGKYSWEFVIDVDATLKSLQDYLNQWSFTIGPELIAQGFIRALPNVYTPGELKTLQPTLIAYAEKNYHYSRLLHEYNDLEPGMAKAVHDAIKNAWSTGTKIAKLLDDIDMAVSIENGLPALVSYAGLFYAGMEERDDLVKEYQEVGGIGIDSSSLYFSRGSEMLDGNSVQEMERLRSVLISLSNFEWENMNNFQNMRTVFEKNESWYFTTDYEENGFVRYFDRPDYQFGLLSFPSDDFIEDTKDMVNEFKTVFLNVPDELKEYVESIQ